MLFQFGLLLHIIGIFMIGGGSIGNLVAEKNLWKYVQQSSDKSKIMTPLMATFSMIVLPGMLLMPISGVLMLGAVNWGFWGQSWLYVKIILYLIAFFNGLLVAKPTIQQIGGIIQSGNQSMAVLLPLKKKMTRFHRIQYTLFILIIVCVIFKI